MYDTLWRPDNFVRPMLCALWHKDDVTNKPQIARSVWFPAEGFSAKIAVSGKASRKAKSAVNIKQETRYGKFSQVIVNTLTYAGFWGLFLWQVVAHCATDHGRVARNNI
jgi:hypothetical protein